jgi:hypothetical protein
LRLDLGELIWRLWLNKGDAGPTKTQHPLPHPVFHVPQRHTEHQASETRERLNRADQIAAALYRERYMVIVLCLVRPISDRQPLHRRAVLRPEKPCQKTFLSGIVHFLNDLSKLFKTLACRAAFRCGGGPSHDILATFP